MPYAGRTNAVHSALKALGWARLLVVAVALVLGCARIEPPYCIKVIDGDTLDVWTGEKIERIRLIGVDTPETKDPRRKVQRFGKESSTFLRKTIKGKTLRLERVEKDAYTRTLAFVYLPDGRASTTSSSRKATATPSSNTRSQGLRGLRHSRPRRGRPKRDSGGILPTSASTLATYRLGCFTGQAACMQNALIRINASCSRPAKGR